MTADRAQIANDPVEIARVRLANGLHVSDAMVHDLVAELDRLRAAMKAAVTEFDDGKPMSAYSFLLNAQEGEI